MILHISPSIWKVLEKCQGADLAKGINKAATNIIFVLYKFGVGY